MAHAVWGLQLTLVPRGPLTFFLFNFCFKIYHPGGSWLGCTNAHSRTEGFPVLLRAPQLMGHGACQALLNPQTGSWC